MLSHDAIAAHIRHLEAIGRSEETIRCARKQLLRWDRQLPMGILVALPEELEEILADRTPGTRLTYYHTLIRFFRWATERAGIIDYDPSAALSRPQKPRRVPRLAPDRHVAIACDAPNPWRLLFRLAAFAGLRCCEIARLDRTDITAAGIRVRGKGGHERVVPCPPEVWEVAERLPPGRVAGGRSARQVSSACNEYLHDRLGLRPTTMHRFRVWYATQAMRNGADLRTVQELLGHSNVNTTVVYTFVADDAKQAAVARMPRLDSLS